MRVEGLTKLVAQLRDRVAAARKDNDARAAVSFSTGYALYVHENLEAYHPVGQAKFLEQPARTMQDVLSAIVTGALQAGKTLAQSLLLAGLRLLREAQLLCPVQTGTLKNSGTVSLE